MPNDKEEKECFNENQSGRPRPLWQRLLYPIIGFILIILGIILWIMPVVPGFPLIIIGLPLLFCFHSRLEHWIRKKMHTVGQSLKNTFKRK
jgi:uncharacterized membrane protein YbaN (DUF454 family)